MTSALVDDVDFQFGGKLIYQTRDKWGDIFVVEKNSHRILAFDSMYQQSRMNPQQPAVLVHDYLKAMMLVLMFVKPKVATLLGLGGGDLARALLAVSPDAEIHAVELRPEVVRVTQQYFNLPDCEKLKVFTGDANHFIQNSTDKTSDVIFSDMFSTYGISDTQFEQQFLQNCHRVLTDAGWLVANFHQLPLPDSDFFDCVNELYPAVYLCPVPGGNFILFAGKQSLFKPIEHSNSDLPLLEQKMQVELSAIFKRIIPFSEY